MDSKRLAPYIDHTLLKPDAKEEEILKACDEAIRYGFKGLCIESKWLTKVVPRLKGSKTLAVTVVSFPQGNASTDQKAKDTEFAITCGAQEVDMVLNRELLKQGKTDLVLKDIQAVVKAAGSIPVKVILETSELTDEEKTTACKLSKQAGARFVKTSTGFSKGGATVEDVRLMRKTVGPEMGLKASGGIRSYEDAVKMVEAGATRLGTSASIAIVEGSSTKSGNY